MKLKINFLNNLSYSIVINDLEKISNNYSENIKQAYPSYPLLYKTLASKEQLLNLANGKKNLSNVDKKLLLPILHLDEAKLNNNYLIDQYQTKQYIRLQAISELTRFMKTNKGYTHIIDQINKGDDGLDFLDYAKKSKQVTYIRDSKLIIMILTQFTNNHNIAFRPSEWDASSISEILRNEINIAFNYFSIQDSEIIKHNAINYSNTTAEQLRLILNNTHWYEEKLLISLTSTFEQFSSLIKPL